LNNVSRAGLCNRDSPDDSQIGVNTRASLGFPQDRREVPLATGISGATVIESADSIARAIETPSS